MPRSLLREDQFKDIDVLSETEHDTEVQHYYRKLADVTTYSGHANEFVVVNTSGDGLTFTQSSAGFVEDLYYNSTPIMSTASDGIVIINNSDAIYFGAATISGSWRIRVVDGNLLFEKYDGSIWNEKFTMDESGEPLLSIF
jgi:hypothetical protein